MVDTKQKNILTDSQIMRRNLLVAFVLMLLLLLCYAVIPGYKYAINEVAFRNKENIDKIETRRLNFNRPELRMADKFMFRIEDYWYIFFMIEHTPDTAVILLPPFKVVEKTPEFNLLNSAEYMEYFLYPRLCISEDEKEIKKDLYSKITHVAIVNNWGYDKLKYHPAQHPPESVMPIDSPMRDLSHSQMRAINPFQTRDTSLPQTSNPK